MRKKFGGTTRLEFRGEDEYRKNGRKTCIYMYVFIAE